MNKLGSEREKKIITLALSYMWANLDNVNEVFEMYNDGCTPITEKEMDTVYGNHEHSDNIKDIKCQH